MTEGESISDVECPSCGSEKFGLTEVDEQENEEISVYVFCSDCGKSLGKMWARTIDTQLKPAVSGDSSEENVTRANP